MVTAAIWGSKNVREFCSIAVVLAQNGVHLLPKSHRMHGEVGNDVSSGVSSGHVDPCFCYSSLLRVKQSPKKSSRAVAGVHLRFAPMDDDEKTKPRLEIAHVLFIDIVGYSKLLTDEQSEALQELNQIVRSTEAAREAEAAGQLIILPTGDGMALVFTGSVERPAECALEISQVLHAQPSVPVRMGIHSGPVQHVTDANARENISGVGINIARRVMDCGDAGHILVSKRFAGDLSQHRRWQRYLHELGEVEVKHGVVVSLVNLYAETIGNPTPPSCVAGVRRSRRVAPPRAKDFLQLRSRSLSSQRCCLYLLLCQ